MCVHAYTNTILLLVRFGQIQSLDVNDYPHSVTIVVVVLLALFLLCLFCVFKELIKPNIAIIIIYIYIYIYKFYLICYMMVIICIHDNM